MVLVLVIGGIGARHRAGVGWHAGVAGQEAAVTTAEGGRHDVTKILGLENLQNGTPQKQ